MNKNCCRICLIGNESQLIELFWVDAGVTYADKVKFCSGIEVLKKDNLPQKICFDCSDSVRSACDIKRKCIETDRLLKSQFKNEPCYAENFDELSVFCLPVLGDTQESHPSPEEVKESVTVKKEVSSENESDVDDVRSISTSSQDEIPVKFRRSRKTKTRTERRSAIKRLCKNCGCEFNIQQTMFVDVKDVLCQACQKLKKSSKASSVFECELCPNAKFEYESTLRKHEEIVHHKKSYKTLLCGLCDFSTRNKATLQEHVQNAHESSDRYEGTEKNTNLSPGIFEEMKKARGRPEEKLCLFCGSVFASVKKRKDHLKEKHSKELECKTCHAKKPSVFSTETCMKIHLFGHRYLCTVCAKGFSKEAHLKRHERQVHFKDFNLGKTFYCDLCGHQTKRKECIREHVLRHTKAGNKKFPCPHESCQGVAYSLLNALNRHLYLNHNVVAPLSCPVCFTGFTYNFEVTKHLKHCSGVAKPPKVTTRVKKESLYEFFRAVGDKFHCKLCLRIFDSEDKFNFHYNETHRDGKTCNLCGKSFKSIDHRNKHIKIIHNKIKDYNCDHPGCGKSFGTIFVLQEHQNTHTGMRPFPCTYCDFSAGSRSTQYKHIRRKHKFELQRDQEQSTSAFHRFP